MYSAEYICTLTCTAAVMACNAMAGNVGRVLPAPIVRSDFAHIRRQRRHNRRLAPTAAAVDTQRTPVQVNQLMIAKDVEQLITTGQNVSSVDDPLHSEAKEFGIGLVVVRCSSTPCSASSLRKCPYRLAFTLCCN